MNVKQTFLLSVFIALVPVSGLAQSCTLLNDHKFDWDNTWYFWGGGFSENPNRIHLGHSFLAGYVLDTNGKVLSRFDANDVTGTTTTMTRDGKYHVGAVRHMMSENDTLVIRSLDDNSERYITCKQSARFIPFEHSNKILVGIWGTYEVVDLEDLSRIYLKKKFVDGAMKDMNPFGLFVNNDQELIAMGDAYVDVISTKKWKKTRSIETTKDCSNLGATEDGKHYFYTCDGEVTIRNSSDHSSRYVLDMHTKYIYSLAVSSDLSFMLYIDRLKNVYYYDFTTNKKTKLVKAGNYAEPTELFFQPGENRFMIAVNGNRLLTYELNKSGLANQGDLNIPVFEYSEEYAKNSKDDQLQVELALKKKGYDIPLDNMLNDADKGLYELFCKEHGFENINTDEARKFLGLAPLE